MQLNITATLGTLNVAAEVEGVKVKGDGEMHMTLSSSLLPSLNRQLQFVSYTNTLFHPSTADTGGPAALQPLHVFIFCVFFIPKDIRTILKCILLICVVAVQLETEGHQAAFIIKIGHGATPKLYNTGGGGGGNECGRKDHYTIFITCQIL